MCPDKQTLSAYFDGELEKPFNDIVAAHIRSCNVCRSEVTGLESLTRYLHNEQEPNFKRCKERVRENLENKLPAASSQNFWHKRVSLPIPLAMAGTVLFFLLIGGILILINGYNTSVPALAAGESRQAKVLMTDLEMVTRYMESQNDIIEVTMQLPDEPRFYFSGEPRLIREQDFRNSRK